MSNLNKAQKKVLKKIDSIKLKKALKKQFLISNNEEKEVFE